MIKTQSNVASWELVDQIRRLVKCDFVRLVTFDLNNGEIIALAYVDLSSASFQASYSNYRPLVPGKNEFGLRINLLLYNPFRQKAQLSPKNMKNKRLQAAKLSIGSNGPVDCRSDHKFSLILIS
ncbi:Inversin [Trichinella pseudospiralis]